MHRKFWLLFLGKASNNYGATHILVLICVDRYRLDSNIQLLHFVLSTFLLRQSLNKSYTNRLSYDPHVRRSYLYTYQRKLSHFSARTAFRRSLWKVASRLRLSVFESVSSKRGLAVGCFTGKLRWFPIYTSSSRKFCLSGRVKRQGKTTGGCFSATGVGTSWRFTGF